MANGDDDLLNLIVEIQGYHREDAIEKNNDGNLLGAPGVNNFKHNGRWAIAELIEAYQIELDFANKVEA